MKTIKIFLCSFLILHIFAILTINFKGLRYFDNPDYLSRLNEFGKKVVTNVDSYTPTDKVRSYFRAYATYLGVDRGYSFFSPNISNSSLEFQFVDNNGNELKIPFNSSESELKFSATDSFLESYLIGNEEIRNRIVKSLSKWIFANNIDITSINIYLKLSHFENIQSEKILVSHMQKEIFFGFTVERNKLKQL